MNDEPKPESAPKEDYQVPKEGIALDPIVEAQTPPKEEPPKEQTS